jgi:hypothetical protein
MHAPNTEPAPADLVCFDVELETGTLSVSAGRREARHIVNWLCEMGWVSREYRDTMFEGLR